MSMNTIIDEPKFINWSPLDKQPIYWFAFDKKLRLPKNLIWRVINVKSMDQIITYENLEKIKQCFIRNLPPDFIKNLSEILKERLLGNAIKITDKMRMQIRAGVYEIAKSRPEFIKSRTTINYNTLSKEMGFISRRLEVIIGYDVPGEDRFMTLCELKRIQRLFRDHFYHNDLDKLHIFNLPDYNNTKVEITPTLRAEIKAYLKKIIHIKRNQDKLRSIDLWFASQQNQIGSYNVVHSTKAAATFVEETHQERENVSYKRGTASEEVGHLSKKVKTLSPHPFSTSTSAFPEFKFFALEEAFPHWKSSF